jgi:geranylgeranyl reductase family protein
MESQTPLSADVIIVGAGPGGATTATYLARAGLDVLLLEKTNFPREKVCGDGLTPRAVKQLINLGIDTSESAGWLHNKGLRIVGGGHRLEIPWPDLAAFPEYGLVRPRADFDELLARTAAAAGARLHEDTPVTGPIIDDRTGRVIGVVARAKGEPPREFRAPVVIAADGNSSRLALSVGREKRDDRPMGVAVRTYYKSPRDKDEWLESWLELWDGTDLLPGYGWIFGMGDGTCNVGLGILNTSDAFQKVDYKSLLAKWLDQTPEEWGFRDVNRTQEVRGAALPMGFNRQPHYERGLLLVGDAGGMVNPFNGGHLLRHGVRCPGGRNCGAGTRARQCSRDGACPAGVSGRAEEHLWRLLHAGSLVRRSDRAPRGNEDGHDPRAQAGTADAFHPETAGKPD